MHEEKLKSIVACNQTEHLPKGYNESSGLLNGQTLTLITLIFLLWNLTITSIVYNCCNKQDKCSKSKCENEEECKPFQQRHFLSEQEMFEECPSKIPPSLFQVKGLEEMSERPSTIQFKTFGYSYD